MRFGSIIDVATDGTYLYATQVDCGTGFTVLIRKVDISTGATSTLSTTVGGAGYVTFSGGYLFATSGSSIVKIDVSTMPDTSSTFATLGDNGHGIVGDGTNLWVSVGSAGNPSSLDSVDLSSSSVTTVATRRRQFADELD